MSPHCASPTQTDQGSVDSWGPTDEYEELTEIVVGDWSAKVDILLYKIFNQALLLRFAMDYHGGKYSIHFRGVGTGLAHQKPVWVTLTPAILFSAQIEYGQPPQAATTVCEPTFEFFSGRNK